MRLRPLLALVAMAALIWGPTSPSSAACPGECSVPGGGSKNTDCLVEFDGPTLNSPAKRPRSLKCTDGDGSCDTDGVANGFCVFRIATCLNNTDGRIPTCTPTDVASFDIRNKPIGHPRHDPQLQSLQDAVTGLGLPSAAAVCTAPTPIIVPLRVRGGKYRAGRLRISAKTATSAGVRDADRVRFVCQPSTELPAPGATYARAKVITTQGERIEGPLGRSNLGDFLLVNDKIQVAIGKPGRNAAGAVAMYGGNIMDAERHRPDGSEHDNFEALAPGINIENTAHYTDVMILNDGTNGLPAVVRATGPDDLLDYINPSSVVAGFGFAFPASADDRDLPVDVQTDYTLAAGVSYVRMDTTLTNTGPSSLSIFFGDYLNGSGQVELFTPTYGFGEPLATVACPAATYKPCAAGSCDTCNFIAYAGEDGAAGVSYGYIHGFNGTSNFNTSGVSVSLLGREVVLTLIGALPPNFSLAASGMPGDSLTFTRYFAVGDGSVASITDIRNQIQGVTTGTLAGTVTSGGLPVADADVAVLGTPAPGPLGAPTRNVITHFRTAADGTYEGTLPPGSYTVEANLDGRLAATPGAAPVAIVAATTTTQDFTLPGPGRLHVTVTDQLGQPIPAKVELVGFDPSPDPGNTQSILGLIDNFTGVFGEQREDGVEHGIAFVAFADRAGDTGTREVEPGSYWLAVSHGPRFSAYFQPVTITENATTTVPVQLAQVIQTPGFIAGDWHVHSIDSADCEVTREERVATQLAEGMDFFTPSDHEIRVDFAPTLAAMGVADLIGTAPSAEITTFDYGHFNSWPVTVDPNLLNGGSVDHGRAGVAPGMDFPAYGSYNLTPAEVFAAAHADPMANLIQINHMRSFFDRGGLDIDTAEGGAGPPQSHVDPAARRLDPGVSNFFDSSFDALEVWIGTDGRSGNLDTFVGQNLGDWFNLLNQGILRTGVTSSDTHQRRTTQLNARSYVASAVSDPALLSADPETLAANVVAGRLTGTNAPFVQITAHAASTGETAGLTLDKGTLIQTTDGAVDVTVTVASPLWAEFDRVEFYVNNAPQPFDDDGKPATRMRYRVIPDYVRTAGVDFTVSTVNDFPAIAGAEHYEATVTLPLAGLTQDTWIVALVRGTDGVSHPLFPVIPNSLRQTGNTTLTDLVDGNLNEEGVTSLAYTNPLYVDADGIAGWTPPGVMLTPP